MDDIRTADSLIAPGARTAPVRVEGTVRSAGAIGAGCQPRQECRRRAIHVCRADELAATVGRRDAPPRSDTCDESAEPLAATKR